MSQLTLDDEEANRQVREATGCTEEEADAALNRACGDVDGAIEEVVGAGADEEEGGDDYLECPDCGAEFFGYEAYTDALEHREVCPANDDDRQ